MTNSTSIHVTKHHHACVTVEDEATRILIDPGQLGSPPALAGVEAILITHQHFDHFDPDLIAKAAARSIPVWMPPDAADDFTHLDNVHEAVAGDVFTVRTLTVEIAGDRHAEVHPQVAGPQNRAYLIGGAVFITGDEHPAPPGPFTALVTPIDAPWLRATDLIQYVHRHKPHQVIGIHDGLLNTHGLDVARHSARTLLNEGCVHASVPDEGTVIEVCRDDD